MTDILRLATTLVYMDLHVVLILIIGGSFVPSALMQIYIVLLIAINIVTIAAYLFLKMIYGKENDHE